MAKKSKTSTGRTAGKTTTATPQSAKLEVVLAFDGDWGRQYNTLAQDKAGNLFLCDSPGDTDAITPDEFEPATLKTALAWFGECEGFSQFSYGSIAPICKLAAAKL